LFPSIEALLSPLTIRKVELLTSLSKYSLDKFVIFYIFIPYQNSNKNLKTSRDIPLKKKKSYRAFQNIKFFFDGTTKISQTYGKNGCNKIYIKKCWIKTRFYQFLFLMKHKMPLFSSISCANSNTNEAREKKEVKYKSFDILALIRNKILWK
jgi:hypothetical protein